MHRPRRLGAERADLDPAAGAAAYLEVHCVPETGACRSSAKRSAGVDDPRCADRLATSKPVSAPRHGRASRVWGGEECGRSLPAHAPSRRRTMPPLSGGTSRLPRLRVLGSRRVPAQRQVAISPALRGPTGAACPQHEAIRCGATRRRQSCRRRVRGRACSAGQRIDVVPIISGLANAARQRHGGLSRPGSPGEIDIATGCRPGLRSRSVDVAHGHAGSASAGRSTLTRPCSSGGVRLQDLVEP